MRGRPLLTKGAGWAWSYSTHATKKSRMDGAQELLGEIRHRFILGWNSLRRSSCSELQCRTGELGVGMTADH